MGKGKRNKIKSKKSNKLNKNTTPKMSLKERFFTGIKEYKFIIILAVIFSVYVSLFPKDYTSDLIDMEKQIEVLTSKLDEFNSSNEDINREVEELTAKRDKLKEELDNLKSN